jgi:predicted HAD superfamily Cof-like phosphohydrolase
MESEDEVSDIQHDVRQFMAAFNQAMPDTPQWPDQETMDLRVRLKAEEFCEWLRDSGYMFHLSITGVDADGFPAQVFEEGQLHHRYSPNLAKSADALIDELYVTIGTLLAMGIDLWPLWREVQRANMAKVGGPVVDGKVRKPANWNPPDIEGLLRKQGWEGEPDGR